MKTGKLFELKLFGLKKETIQMLFNRLCLVTYGKVPETSLCVILIKSFYRLASELAPAYDFDL